MTPHALRIRTGIEGDGPAGKCTRYRAFVRTTLNGADQLFTDRTWFPTEAEALKKANEIALAIRGHMKARGHV